MTDALTRATYDISDTDLKSMVLCKTQLPYELSIFEPFREGLLDNAVMAEHGFPGSDVESLNKLNRITGYFREFTNPFDTELTEKGTDLVAATVVHLFRDEQAASLWMEEVFVKQFEDNVGKSTKEGQQLLNVGHLEVGGFHHKAVGLKAVQGGPNGLLSSTVIDFRIGRLLGVAYVVTIGDSQRNVLAQELAKEFEHHIVRVVLGSA